MSIEIFAYKNKNQRQGKELAHFQRTHGEWESQILIDLNAPSFRTSRPNCPKRPHERQGDSFFTKMR